MFNCASSTYGLQVSDLGVVVRKLQHTRGRWRDEPTSARVSAAEWCTSVSPIHSLWIIDLGVVMCKLQGRAASWGEGQRPTGARVSVQQNVNL